MGAAQTRQIAQPDARDRGINHLKPVVEERVEVGPWRFVIERPANADALVDEESFARDELLPYWAELWPSAIALARHVATLPLAGRRVLEFGCGLGLPAIVAARTLQRACPEES